MYGVVIEDDPETQSNLREILELDGFEVEVAGLAQVLTPVPADGQLAINVGAQFLAHRGLCGGFAVPSMIQGTQIFDPKHEYWKQTFRCP